MNLAAFVLILTSKLSVASPLLSYIINLTTAIHCTIVGILVTGVTSVVIRWARAEAEGGGEGGVARVGTLVTATSASVVAGRGTAMDY